MITHTKRHRPKFIYLFLTLSISKTLAQSVEIGKMKNVIFSREIKFENLGNINSSNSPVYFKSPNSNQFEKIGRNGKKLIPYLNLTNPSVKLNFDKYLVNNRKANQYLIIWSLTAPVFMSSVLYDNFYKNITSTSQLFFSPKQIIILAGGITIGYVGVYFRLKGEKNLKKLSKESYDF